MPTNPSTNQQSSQSANQQPPTPMRQPHTPGSVSHTGGPRTPGHAGPGTLKIFKKICMAQVQLLGLTMKY